MNSFKIFLLLLLFAVNAQATEQKTAIQIPADHVKNLGVTLGKLEPASRVPLLYAPASVTIPPAKEAIVSSSQPGLVTKLAVAVGDQVTKGTVLATINSPELLSLQAQYLKMGSALKLAATSYNRDKTLSKEGVIANRREQETRASYDAASLNLNEARQLLEIAGMSANEISNLDNKQRFNSELTIHAPQAGVVIERMVVVGTRIDSLAPLYRIADINELWLEIAIPQERIHDIKLGDQVLIDKSPIKAVITLLGQNVNPENQSVMARALIQGHPNSIRVGQKVNIQVIQPSIKTVYKVPNTALAQNEGKTYLFVRTPTGFNILAVQVTGKQGNESIISADLNGTEEIAVNGAVALKANWLGLGSEE